VEMDGLDNVNDGLFLIGATNQPWDVDPAFRRPGRLDHTVLVLPPDPHARRAIFELHLRGRPTAIKSLSEVVLATEDFSGADLKRVCDEAAQRALAESTRLGEIRPITDAALLTIAGSMRPSTGAWMEMARNFATYANTAGEYDELAEYLRTRRRPRR
jgi:SpoVK/Ycf46/Vps4 family AAA+-type ATPase